MKIMVRHYFTPPDPHILGLLGEETVSKIQELGKIYNHTHDQEGVMNFLEAEEARKSFLEIFFGECDPAKRKALYELTDSSLIDSLDSLCPYLYKQLYPPTRMEQIKDMAKELAMDFIPKAIRLHVFSNFILGSAAPAEVKPQSVVPRDFTPPSVSKIEAKETTQNDDRLYKINPKEFMHMIENYTSPAYHNDGLPQPDSFGKNATKPSKTRS